MGAERVKQDSAGTQQRTVAKRIELALGPDGATVVYALPCVAHATLTDDRRVRFAPR